MAFMGLGETKKNNNKNNINERIAELERLIKEKEKDLDETRKTHEEKLDKLKEMYEHNINVLSQKSAATLSDPRHSSKDEQEFIRQIEKEEKDEVTRKYEEEKRKGLAKHKNNADGIKAEISKYRDELDKLKSNPEKEANDEAVKRTTENPKPEKPNDNSAENKTSDMAKPSTDDKKPERIRSIIGDKGKSESLVREELARLVADEENCSNIVFFNFRNNDPDYSDNEAEMYSMNNMDRINLITPDMLDDGLSEACDYLKNDAVSQKTFIIISAPELFDAYHGYDEDEKMRINDKMTELCELINSNNGHLSVYAATNTNIILNQIKKEN